MTEHSAEDPTLDDRRWSWALGLAILIIGAILLGAYTGNLPTRYLKVIPYYDTIMHFALIGGAGYLAYRASRRRHVHLWKMALPLGPLIVGLVAGAEEFLQLLSPQRAFEVADLCADFVGLASFYLIDRLWVALRKKNQL